MYMIRIRTIQIVVGDKREKEFSPSVFIEEHRLQNEEDFRILLRALYAAADNYKYHRAHLYEKLGLHSKYLIIIKAMMEGWREEL